MKIITYHYVRPNSRHYPYFNNFSFLNFKKQLDMMQKKFYFLSKEQFLKNILKNSKISGIVLTFDDGLKDHYRYVLPELQRRNLWGIFYIPFNILKFNKILPVHKIHILKGRFGSKKILDDILKFYPQYKKFQLINSFEKEVYKSNKHKVNDIKLKKLLNFYVKYNDLDNILQFLFNKYKLNEIKIFNEFYLNNKDIKKINSSGNIIGAHTMSHKVLSRLNSADQYYELSESLRTLKNLKIKKPYLFAYPYGYRSSYNNTTITHLKKLGYHSAVIFDNKISKNISNKFVISRIDCINNTLINS